MKRLAIGTPLLLTLIVAGIVMALLYTETGLRWSFRLAQTQVPGDIHAERLSGRLTGPLEIIGLRYRDDAVDVRIGRIALDWRPLALFAGRVAIRELIVEDSDIRINDATQGDSAAPRQRGIEDLALTLPVRQVTLDRLDIRNATLHLTDRDPLTLDRLELRAVARDDTIAINEFRIDAAGFTVDAEGRLPLSTTGPLRISTRFRGEIDGQPWRGAALLAGTPAAIDAQLTLDQPIGVLGEAKLEPLAEPLRWQASVGADPFSLDELFTNSRPLRITAAEIEASGSGAALRATAGLSVSDEEFGRWGIDLEGGIDGDRRELRRLAINALDGDARIEGRAAQTVGTDGADDRFDVDLQWQDLVWPPTGATVVRSPQGSAQLSGTLDDYRFTLAGGALITDLPPLELALNGAGNLEGIDIRELHGDFLDGQWRGTGLFEWRPALRWELALAADGIDPAALHPELAGRLDGRLQLNGGFDDALALEVEIERLNGTLRDFPFDSHARLTIEDSVIDIRDLFVRAGGLELTGGARLAEQWDIGWRLEADGLGVVHPELDGVAQSQGTVTGPPDALHFWLSLDAGNLSWGEHGIDSLALSADLGLGDTEQWRVSAHADGARITGREVGRIAIDTEGTTLDHQAALRIEHEDHRLEQHLAGALGEGRWQGRLRQGHLEETHIGAWSQSADTRFEITPDTMELDDFCWRQAPASVCLRGDRDAETHMQARLEWQVLDLSRLDPWLADRRSGLSGETRGIVEVHVRNDMPGPLRLEVRSEAHSEAGALRYPLPLDGEIRALDFESIALTANADAQQGLHAELRVILNELEHVNAALALPQWRPDAPLPGPEQALGGQLDVELHDLSALSLILPDWQAGDGKIVSTAGVAGTVGEPRIDGDLRFTLDHLAFARFGVRLDELDLTAGVRQNDWTLAGNARMDQGRLDIAGHGTVRSMTDWNGEISLNGENLQTLRLPTAEVVTSPAITVRANPEELVFDGSLRIPRARLEPVAPESVVPVSRDIVIVGDVAIEEAPTPYRTHGRIELILGDQVRLIGMGFEGRLTGRLVLLLERDGSVNGQGEILVADGRYRAYGQNLSITRGRVLYAGGPLDNPAIDIVASRMRGDIEVGVRVTGTAEQPQVALFSNPAMDDADVLSYLVLGRPMDQAGEGDGQLLHQAAGSIALVGGEALAERISDRFGIAEVSIEAGDDVADAALVLGRALSQRLYVRYIQGLVENTSAVQLRYQLSDKWTIETESGTRSGAGADILYTLER